MSLNHHARANSAKIFIVSFILLGMTSVATASQRIKHIVGGIEAAPGEFPFIVSMQESGFGHFCGGSLIAKNWVLTAAHCVSGFSSLKNTIVIGLHDQKDMSNAEVMKPVRVIVHPLNKSNTVEYDFALIQLDHDSKFAPVAVNATEIDIPTSGLMINSITAGWGAIAESDNTLPDKLQKVEVPLVNAKICETSYPTKIKDSMICAGLAKGGKDSRQGDSGGPLVVEGVDHKPVLAGVVSWGRGCARANFYGIYAKTNVAFDWIAKTIAAVP